MCRDRGARVRLRDDDLRLGAAPGCGAAAIFSENEEMRAWVQPLLRGARRGGLALGGALPGKPQLLARPTAEGWLFDGCSPFVSGWGRVDVIHTAARTEDGRLVWALVDASESDTLAVERLRLVALDSTPTVRAELRSHPVPAERVTSVSPYVEGPTPPEVLRIHASLALGVAGRCCTLLGPSPLDDEIARVRDELDRVDPATIQGSRAQAGELAVRAASTL